MNVIKYVEYFVLFLTGMNRHHYGLYIHGDKLVLLLRKEAEDVHSPKEMEIFKPAEFRWRIPHVMDNEWHHYAVSVDKERANNNDGGVRSIFISLRFSF